MYWFGSHAWLCSVLLLALCSEITNSWWAWKRCQRLNLVQPHIRQMPYLLYYLFKSVFLMFCIYSLFGIVLPFSCLFGLVSYFFGFLKFLDVKYVATVSCDKLVCVPCFQFLHWHPIWLLEVIWPFKEISKVKWNHKGGDLIFQYWHPFKNSTSFFWLTEEKPWKGTARMWPSIHMQATYGLQNCKKINVSWEVPSLCHSVMAHQAIWCIQLIQATNCMNVGNMMLSECQCFQRLFLQEKFVLLPVLFYF